MLVREVPALREVLWWRWFLTGRTATVQLGLVGIAVAAVTRRGRPAVVALPWLVAAVRDARDRPGRALWWRLAQVLLADAVAAEALAEGAVRHRALLL